MKNIHIIPTDRPSRLVSVIQEISKGQFKRFYYMKSTNDIYDGRMALPQHYNIYITSDEEIKEGDWFLTDDKRVEKYATDWRAREWHRKIILTTDPRLAPDVQKIDDEFLEWFVKNPSCEVVKVEKEHDDTVPYPKMRYVKPYKIIIPKEEPKQEILEELGKTISIKDAKKDSFEDVTKYKIERSYSEEDVLNFTQTIIQQYKCGNTNIEQLDLLKETLELFKNK